MTHYDCSNCGESMGIGFGYCSACTPSEFNRIEAEIMDVRRAAEAAWEKNIKEEAASLAERKAAFIKAHTAGPMEPLTKRLHEIKMKHHHGYRYDYERKQKTRMIHGPTGEEIHVAPGAQIPLFPNL